MINNRYVVLNCPAITTGWNDEDYICNTHQMGCGHCQDCTDCIIKQVIEKCKDAHSECSCENPNKDIDCFECTSGGRAELGVEILQLFDIEGINK